MLRILIIIAVLLLGGSVYLGTVNQSDLQAEKVETGKNEEILARTKGLIAEEETKIADAEKARSDAQAAAEKNQQETDELRAKNETAAADIEKAKASATENKEKLEALTENAKGLPDMDAIAENINLLKGESSELQQEVSDGEAKLAAAEAKVKVAEARLKAVETEEANIRNRISPADLSAKLLNVNQSFGFVILDAGVDQSVMPTSRLAVMRGGNKIADLVVKTVEKSRSAADIVPNSIVPGQTLMPGDKVVSVRPPETPVVSKAEAPKATPQPKVDAPADTQENTGLESDSAADTTDASDTTDTAEKEDATSDEGAETPKDADSTEEGSSDDKGEEADPFA